MAKNKSKHHATANPKPIAVSKAPVKKKFPVKKVLIPVLAVALIALIVVLCLPDKKDVPLTEEQKDRISQDWLANSAWHWTDEEGNGYCRYYGEFEGYDIVFRYYSSLEPLEVVIADQVFSHNYEFNLIAYKDDTLTELSDLYKAGSISKESVAAIAAVHQGDPDKWPTLDEAKRGRIEALWQEANVSLKWDSGELQKRSTRYYGTYNGYIVFLNVDAVPPESLGYYRYNIAGATFENNCSATIYGYKDGQFIRLRDLYTQGAISAEEVADIAEKHAKGV